MNTTTRAVTPGLKTPRGFPLRSLAIFLAVAVLLRLFTMVAWAFFPGHGLFPQLARILIPLSATIGLLVLNHCLLVRDRFPPNALGLSLRQSGWFFLGGLSIAPILLLMAGALWLLIPFHWERGPLTPSQWAWLTAEYFAGNFGEELAFRGYLLLLFTRHFGLPRALFITAFLFGLFHLPGLSGWMALKMVCTTGAMAFLFAYGFLLSGSLWTAVGLHVLGNAFLHHFFGLGPGQNSIFKIVLHQPWPNHYDPAFVAWFAVLLPLILLAAWLHRRQNRPLPLTT